MPPEHASSNNSSDMLWIIFSLMTVLCWGLYGPMLQTGSVKMMGDGPPDHVTARYKAFLFVGIAYLLTAVIGPLVMLMINKTPLTFSGSGIGWSLFAGLLGAAGAFFVLLAFGAKGPPGAVMSIILAGAPVVNSVFLIFWNKSRFDDIHWQFYLGMLMAAAGGCLVTLYRPPPPPQVVVAVPAIPNVKIEVPVPPGESK